MKSIKNITQSAKEAFDAGKPILQESLRFGRDGMLVAYCWSGVFGADLANPSYDLNLLQQVGVAYGTSYGIALGSGIGQVLDKKIRAALIVDKSANKPWGVYGAILAGGAGGYFGNDLAHDIVTGEWLLQKARTAHVQPASQSYLNRQKDFENGFVKGNDGLVLAFS